MKKVIDFEEAKIINLEKLKREVEKFKSHNNIKTSQPYYDFPPCENCKNKDSFGAVCVKCNQCGRFDKE